MEAQLSKLLTEIQITHTVPKAYKMVRKNAVIRVPQMQWAVQRQKFTERAHTAIPWISTMRQMREKF